jgi:transcriptional regulator GlxA family with amidase domain
MSISSEFNANPQVGMMTHLFDVSMVHAGNGGSIDIASFSPFQREFLARLHAVMAAHLDMSGFTIASLAKLLGRSPRQLQRDVVRLTGRRPRDILRTHRMLQAQHLLRTRQYRSVAEVADRVGMTTSHFSRTYTAWAGYPPSDELGKQTPLI